MGNYKLRGKFIRDIEPTYKGLKLFMICIIPLKGSDIEPTYKGLKLSLPISLPK